MPQLRELRTATYTNQDISSFRFVGDYTAPFYRTLHASLTAKQLAGGGNYSAYYTMQRVSTTDYFVGPTITVNVPATNNAVIFEFRDIIAEPGNTYRFYIQGLAGDTTTPDTVLRIFEEVSHDVLDWGIVTGVSGNRITVSGVNCVLDDTYNGRLIKFIEPNSGYAETTYITDYDAIAGASGTANIDIETKTSIAVDWLFYIYPQYKLMAQDVRDAAKLAPSAGTPAAGSLDLHLDDLITDADAILSDTGTDLPATLASLAASIASLAAALAVVDGIADSVLEDTGTSLPATLATILQAATNIEADTGTTLPEQIDAAQAALTALLNAILSDTGTDLPGTLAGLAAAIAVIDGIADAILEDTGTTLPAQIEHVIGEDVVPYLELILEDTGTTLPAQIAAVSGEAIVPYLELILEDTGTTLPAEHAAMSDTLAEILEDTDATLPALITSTIVVAVDPPLDGSKINAYIGATLRVTFTNLPVSGTRAALIFTAKKNLDEADSTALVQVLESNPAGDSDGLIYFNGRIAATRQDQARMVSDATEDSVVLTLDDDLTAVLYKTRVQYDIKQFYADGSSTVMTKGVFETRATPTKTINPEEL